MSGRRHRRCLTSYVKKRLIGVDLALRAYRVAIVFLLLTSIKRIDFLNHISQTLTYQLLYDVTAI